MKKLLTVLMLAFLTSAFAMVAHADNVLETPGSYIMKFEGFEYVYMPEYTGDDFMNGNIPTEAFIDDIGEIGNLQYDVKMSAAFYMTQINMTDGPMGSTLNPPVYSTILEDAGAYIAIMRDIYVHNAEGDQVFLTGGVVDLYYLADLNPYTIGDLLYEEGQGVMSVPKTDRTSFNLSEMLALVDPFVSFNLQDTTATVVEDEEGFITTAIKFYGDVTMEFAGSAYDSNAFGDNRGPNADVVFDSSLRWKDGLFSVHDPIYITVNAPAVPEPSSVALMGLGLITAAYFVRKQRQN